MEITRRAALAALAAAAAPAFARPRAADAPALELARFAPEALDPRGFLVSEKYDGARALWDGRVLRFRSGAPIAAPAWFTERLPAVPLDGELWLGRGTFEALSAAVRRLAPDDAEWRALRYMVFDLPGAPKPFAERAARIAALARTAAAPLVAVEQSPVDDRAALARRLEAVVAQGGEGLVLHRAAAAWRPGRSGDVLKLKPQTDAEAVVTGYVAGHGRLAGRVGALRVRSEDGAEFLIGSGLSDAQRAAPPAVGAVVTYTYRGTTATGLPRFATFVRVREV